MIRVEETKFELQVCAKTKCGARRLWSKFRNNHSYLASISRLLKHINNDEIWERLQNWYTAL